MNKKLENRRYVLSGIAILIVAIYVLRLGYLQLLDNDYKKNAERNALYNRTLFPMRGTIFDRNGKALVYNQPAYDVMVIMRDMKNLDTLSFCKMMKMTRAEFDKRMETIKDTSVNRGYSSYTQQVFKAHVSAAESATIQEKLFFFPGFSIRKRNQRKFNYGSGAHILGEVAEVNAEDVERDNYYSAGDFIGRSGVERSYEDVLRGVKGVEVLLRDARGRIQGHYNHGKDDRRPQPGRDITLSLDIELQQLGERLMQGKRGSIVAIEPSTGEVLCMVSAPSYDPRRMEGDERSKYVSSLLKNPAMPMFNRAIQGAYPPGSTFKTSQALTFLQEGIINQNTSYPCANGFRFKGMKVGCHAHPAPINLVPAIATSCNGYFCWGLYYMFGNQNKYGNRHKAMNIWRDYMVSMGFGYKLGVDLPGEARGLIPNAEYYDEIYQRWSGLTVVSISIGQGEVTLTPLQIANLGATIANRGYYVTPHVVKGVEKGDIADSLRQKHYTKVNPRYYNMVIQGMRKAVLDGTCTPAQNPWFEVCGKTGTAQNKGHDHSVFMGFAPRNNPKIAIAVYVENGGWGATFGVPIGALMMEQYINGHLSDGGMARAADIQHRRISYTDPKKETKAKKGTTPDSTANRNKNQ